jgi:predicted 3-demethylubiquinone-9 3-methyltransferase (glyoxalase superfamily)
MIPRIQPCLWFDGDAEEAARFYADTFPDTRIDKLARAPGDYPAGKKGDVLTVEMTILGLPFLLLNGGPEFSFDEAISFQVATEDQAETDRLWNAITQDGGEESMCGWCKDRFGLSWQVVPTGWSDLMHADDPDRYARGFEAMMQMRKIDIAALDRAVAGLGV